MPTIKAPNRGLKRRRSAKTSARSSAGAARQAYPKTRQELEARIAAADARAVFTEEDRRACDDAAPEIERILSDPNTEWLDYETEVLPWLLGTVMQHRRKKRTWTRARLARAAKVSVLQIARFERGEWKKTDPAFQRVARVLEVNFRI